MFVSSVCMFVGIACMCVRDVRYAMYVCAYDRCVRIFCMYVTYVRYVSV